MFFDRTNLKARAALISQLEDYARNNVALVQIFIKEPYVTKLKRDEAFSVILFVAGAGGLMGLCTGFSFLSAVEIVYHAFFAIADLCFDLWKRRRKIARDCFQRNKSTGTMQTDTV